MIDKGTPSKKTNSLIQSLVQSSIESIVLTTKKWANLVTFYTITQMVRNEVRVYHFPLLCKNLHILIHISWFVMIYLYLLTIRILSQKIHYVSLHFLLPKHFEEIRVHFSGTWINGILGVVSFSKDLLPKQYHIGNT